MSADKDNAATNAFKKSMTRDIRQQLTDTSLFMFVQLRYSNKSGAVRFRGHVVFTGFAYSSCVPQMVSQNLLVTPNLFTS